MNIHRFIEDKIELIEQRRWLDVYKLLETEEMDTISRFNTVMIKAGINPLEDLTVVPRLFLAWSPIEQIDIPNKITKINPFAFLQSNLKTLILPKYLEEIGAQSFAQCNELETVVIPDEVTLIGRAAFFQCKNLKKVVIGENVRYIQQLAFDLCPKLKHVYYRGTEDDWNHNINMSDDSFNKDTDGNYPEIHYEYKG